MPKIGPEVRTARRNQFIRAARELAAETGFRTLTIDDVCARAGFSKGAFYVHFPSKQELLHAMLEEEIAQVNELLDVLAAGPLPELEKVRAFVRTMVQRAQDPAEVAFRAELWSQVGVDERLRERIAETVRVRRVRLAGFATAGAQSGELVEVPANAFGAVLVALVDGLLLHHAVDPSGFRWENIAKVIDILLDHLGIRPVV
ncbi:MAG TPA: TetR/AcrR family transcriptional regulator [Sporichthyaceae bacterium]|nr:TetR/AcrR family transcriptional regulator [Sporichthyaceae bacterium]